MVQHFLLWRFSDEIRAGDTAPYLEQIADAVLSNNAVNDNNEGAGRTADLNFASA